MSSPREHKFSLSLSQQHSGQHSLLFTQVIHFHFHFHCHCHCYLKCHKWIISFSGPTRLLISSILGSILSSLPNSYTFTFTFTVTVTSNFTNGSICLPFNRPNITDHITGTLYVPWDYHFISRSQGTINHNIS